MKNKTIKNNLKKTLRAFVLATSLFSAVSIGMIPIKAQAFHSSSVPSSISIHATDIIIIKTRIYNGKRQYRRWNETKSCWVDPDWIDIG